MLLHSLTSKVSPLKQLMAVSAIFVGALSPNSSWANWPDTLETPALSSTKVLDSILLDVAKAGDRLVAVGERGHIVFSDDQGLSWKQAKVPASIALTAVHFPNPQKGWAVGHDGIILHSSDAGQTWTKQFDGFEANKKVLEQAKVNLKNAETALENARLGGDEMDIEDASFNLENFQYALEDAEADYADGSTKPLLDVWFKNGREGFAIGAYGFIFKTLDGGASWADWSAQTDNIDRFHLNSIINLGINELLIVGESGTILRSNDGGNRFLKEESPYEGSLFGVIGLQNRQLAFGLRGTMIRYEGQTGQWSMLPTDSTLGLNGGINQTGETGVLVGNGGSFIRVRDGGDSLLAKIRPGRVNTVALVETTGGYFVSVGEKGIQLLDKNGNPYQSTPKLVQQ